MKARRAVQNPQIVIWVKSILRMLNTVMRIHIKVKRARVHQKDFSLAGELLL